MTCVSHPCFPVRDVRLADKLDYVNQGLRVGVNDINSLGSWPSGGTEREVVHGYSQAI